MTGFRIFLACAFALAAAQLKAAERPNILIIFADDIGYEALECYGGQDFKTPNLNRMAAQGMRFSRAYTSPVCTPSRVSLHTGRYASRHGFTTVLPVHNGTSKRVDFTKMPTFAQLLRDAGYATSVTGKWQLATLEKHPDHPRTAGFDSWAVWQIWRDGGKTTRYWQPAINRDGALLQDVSERFGPDVLTDYVIEQMQSAKEAGRPFLILHNEMLPHEPVVETPEDRSKGRPASLGNMIHYMDGQVGRLLTAVDSLGLREQTWVFFIGDNGTESTVFQRNPTSPKGAPRRTDKGLVKGGKRDLNDAGTHVPFLIWGPPAIPAGEVRDGLTDITDMFATVCAIADVLIPEAVKTDGFNLLPHITTGEPSPRQWVHGAIHNNAAVFDGSWRLFSDGRLMDARSLPVESPAKENDPEAQAARARLQTALLEAASDAVPQR